MSIFTDIAEINGTTKDQLDAITEINSRVGMSLGKLDGMKEDTGQLVALGTSSAENFSQLMLAMAELVRDVNATLEQVTAIAGDTHAILEELTAPKPPPVTGIKIVPGEAEPRPPGDSPPD